MISTGLWCYNITLITLIKEACFATEEAVWRITKSQKKLKCRLHVYDMEEIETLSSCVRQIRLVMVMMITTVAKMIIIDDQDDHGDQDGYPH